VLCYAAAIMPAHHLIQRRAQPEPTSVEVMPQSTGTASIGQETMVVKIDGQELENKSLQNDPSLPTEIPAPVSSSVKPVLELETGTAAAPPNNFEDVFETAKPSSDASDSRSGSSTSAGVKAGIAFGVIGVALFIGWLIFFFIGRRKKQAMKNKKQKKPSRHDAEKQVGEKPVVVRTLATDVVADNRPVTTFFPKDNGVNKPLPSVEDLAPPKPVALGAERRARTDSRLWNRPVSTLSSNVDNPFGLYAERVPSPERYPTPSRSPSPIMVNESLPRDIPSNEFEPTAAVAPLAPLARKASLRKNAVAELDLPKPAFAKMPNVPGSPATTEYSMSSAAPTSEAPASTVHRVQQDFEPTMDDEMELRAGQLVRLLHEFDDGWALCVRLDNTKQGVVPRTCISSRPLKPRSQNGDSTSSRRPS
jgi:hypothetical protein